MSSKKSKEESVGSEENEGRQYRDNLPGGALLRLMLEKAERDNLDRYALADRLGITYSYLTLILRGERDVPSISQERLRKIGEFLEIPFIQVLMLGEVVRADDFLESDEKTINQEFDSIWMGINNDPVWRGAAPNRAVWDESAKEMKILVGLMFNQIKQENVLRLAKRVEIVDSEMDLGTKPDKQK